MLVTARLIEVVAAGHDDPFEKGRRLAARQALREVRRLATPGYAACRRQLRHAVGAGQQLWHRPERHATKVQIETGDEHLFTPVDQLQTGIDNAVVEELGLVDGDNGFRSPPNDGG